MPQGILISYSSVVIIVRLEYVTVLLDSVSNVVCLCSAVHCLSYSSLLPGSI
jgi:hypothetical protein